jgi:hypothetical protein
MIRTNTTDAFTTTCAILFVIALIDGKYATGLDWAYPCRVYLPVYASRVAGIPPHPLSKARY